MKKCKLLSLLFASALLFGCASDDVDLDNMTAEQLYNRAHDYLDETRYKKAAETFEKVELEYPYSRWATDAKIMGAYAYYKNESYDATMCNPPFHVSAAAARAGSERKRRNLGQAEDAALNFGGQQQELWCEGGEVAFILRMIAESKQFGRQVKWFTTLVSRGDNLPPLYRALTEAGAVKVVKKEMAQGQKQSRFIAWSFMDDNKRRK